jgi:hypothetical protein
MANLFPLILNTTSSTIQELPSGDNLDLTGSNISNVANITSAGNVTASYFIGNGSSLTGITSSTAVTVTGNAQPNITSVGTLTTLVVSGNLTPTNLVLDSFNETLPASANTGSSITPDVATGTIFRYTANANFTFNSLANAVAGTSATVIITQDGTGSRTLTSTMKFAGASKTLSTAAASIDIIGVFYDGTTYYASLTKGYA